MVMTMEGPACEQSTSTTIGSPSKPISDIPYTKIMGPKQ
jgi:hypothetical protein